MDIPDTLRHVKLNDEQKDRALEHISREGKRLEKLSGKMLQMLGLHQNDSIKMESHSIGELLEHVVQLEAEQAAQRQIQLQTEYEDFSMKMDDELMESLLVNLIDNALRATEAGGRITVKAYKESGRKILEVADNGRGIPQEELGKNYGSFLHGRQIQKPPGGRSRTWTCVMCKNRRSSWRQTGHHKPAWNRNESKSNI